MEIEIVHFMILSDSELNTVRNCMETCHPVKLTEAQYKVKNRLCGDRKFDLKYVGTKVIPHLEWLLNHYFEEKKHAEKQTATDAQWIVIIESRERMIPKVREVHQLFESAVIRSKALCEA